MLKCDKQKAPNNKLFRSKTQQVPLSIHLCGRGVHSLPLNSSLGHISHALSVATGRIPPLFCAAKLSVKKVKTSLESCLFTKSWRYLGVNQLTCELTTP